MPLLHMCQPYETHPGFDWYAYCRDGDEDLPPEIVAVYGVSIYIRPDI